MLKTAPLAGFVVEGFTPYGTSASNARTRRMLRAVHSGLPMPSVLYSRLATCMQPQLKGLTTMTNSRFNGWLMEDVWLDK